MCVCVCVCVCLSGQRRGAQQQPQQQQRTSRRLVPARCSPRGCTRSSPRVRFSEGETTHMAKTIHNASEHGKPTRAQQHVSMLCCVSPWTGGSGGNRRRLSRTSHPAGVQQASRPRCRPQRRRRQVTQQQLQLLRRDRRRQRRARGGRRECGCGAQQKGLEAQPTLTGAPLTPCTWR